VANKANIFNSRRSSPNEAIRMIEQTSRAGRIQYAKEFTQPIFESLAMASQIDFV
jgi:hypothetical protein